MGQDSSPATEPLDKSKVLNVKPLRRLVPVFPSANNVSTSVPNPQGGAPFVCASPSGPFPPGVSPFYPFFFSPELNQQNQSNTTNHSTTFCFNSPISNAVPISSFRTPISSSEPASSQYKAAANGGKGSLRRRRTKRRSQSKNLSEADGEDYSNVQSQNAQFQDTNEEDTTKSGRRERSRKRRNGGENVTGSPILDLDSILNRMLASCNITTFDPHSDGDRESVCFLLILCDMLRRRITQAEESKETTPGVVRRHDSKAVAAVMSKGMRTNTTKRIGVVPGVEIGDIFFFRMEMCLVGLHAPSMAGIDYMTLKNSPHDEPVAVSIVSSGGYEDDNEDANVLIYSGQGGNVNQKDKELKDQKLERGNLALEKSLHRGNSVRVIRGLRDLANPTGKIYVYDGLYKIQESWIEKGKSGCNVFKYKLVRLPGQEEGFMTWKLTQQWKNGNVSRIGLILSDLTSGAENFPVSLVNDVDDEKGPAYFTYFPGLKCSKSLNFTEPSNGCNCIGGCLPANANCPCIRKNGGSLPYSANGLLLSQKSLIHECGPLCNCPPNCRNRLSQGGIKLRLEVFRTKGKGWGLRSWDPIRAGTFICEFAGEVIGSENEKEFAREDDDEYIFDTTRTYHTLESILEGLSAESNESSSPIPSPLIITAKNAGNVARFINHSCSPNLCWKPVVRENKSESDIHVSFHAVRHIAPMTELTYDYGIVPPEKADGMKKNAYVGPLSAEDFSINRILGSVLRPRFCHDFPFLASQAPCLRRRDNFLHSGGTQATTLDHFRI